MSVLQLSFSFSEDCSSCPAGGLTEPCGVVSSGPGVGGGGGAPPALPVGGVGAFVLREAAQAALEVAVSRQAGGQRGCSTTDTIVMMMAVKIRSSNSEKAPTCS